MKKNPLWTLSVPFVNLFFKAFYNVEMKGDLPKSGPCVVLPKHQNLKDVPLEGLFIYSRRKNSARFIMRKFPLINGIFRAYGGITVARPRDLRKGRYTREEADKINQETTDKVLYALKKEEVVVIHPEGTRSPDEMRKIRISKNGTLDQIVRSQELTGEVSFIPTGINYSGRQIHLEAGDPYFTEDPRKLEEHLQKEIPRLSRL